MKKNNSLWSVALLCILVAGGSVYAASTPVLGGSSVFGILSSTYTNTAPGTTITGELGYTTAPFVAPTVTGPTNALYAQAGISQGAALASLNGEACTFTVAGPVDLSTDITHGPIGVYTPGVYCVTGAATIGAGGITLNGAGTYIFRIVGALDTVANSVVSVAGGASPCDVFWTPGAATTLGANSTFLGTNIDDSGITIGSTVNWIGRALAFGGTISTDATTLTVPTCPAPVPPPVIVVTNSGYSTSGGYFVNPVINPIINVTKKPFPTSLPSGPGTVTYNYVVTNPGTISLSTIQVSDDKCASITLISGDTNNNTILEVSEAWTYQCVSMLKETTTNIVTARGVSNGTIATATAEVTVFVGAAPIVPTVQLIPTLPTVLGASTTTIPTFPNAGFAPEENDNSLVPIVSISLIMVTLAFFLTKKEVVRI